MVPNTTKLIPRMRYSKTRPKALQINKNGIRPTAKDNNKLEM
jgi:hypothetical protein